MRKWSQKFKVAKFLHISYNYSIHPYISHYFNWRNRKEEKKKIDQKFHLDRCNTENTALIGHLFNSEIRKHLARKLRSMPVWLGNSNEEEIIDLEEIIAMHGGGLLLHLGQKVANDLAAIVICHEEGLQRWQDLMKIVLHMVVPRKAKEVVGLNHQEVIHHHFLDAHHGGKWLAVGRGLGSQFRKA